MRDRFFTVVGVLAIAIAVVSGQTKKASAPSRLAGEHPDLTGTYDLATLTPLERPTGMPAVISDEEAAKLEKQAAERVESGAAPIKGDRPAPPKGGDGSAGPAGNVGGYNTFWLDPGSRYSIIKGERRSSIVIDPPTGRVPPVTAEARQRNAARVVRTTSDEVIRENDPGFEGGGAYDDPERRPLGERCLLGFSSTSGPPALPNYFYNNLHQIVQTRDSVMILTEMVHDARVVRMGAQHLAKNIRKWMGDSIGRWEGDTLVVDTTNFTDKTRFRGATEDMHVVERFTRVAPNALLYRFTIEDPATWSRPWTGEFTWPATDKPIYEYACHENNYALENILRGARRREADEAAQRTKQ